MGNIGEDIDQFIFKQSDLKFIFFQTMKRNVGYILGADKSLQQLEQGAFAVCAGAMKQKRLLVTVRRNQAIPEKFIEGRNGIRGNDLGEEFFDVRTIRRRVVGHGRSEEHTSEL